MGKASIESSFLEMKPQTPEVAPSACMMIMAELITRYMMIRSYTDDIGCSIAPFNSVA